MSKNHRKPESFIKLPVYEGGQKALNEFVRSNLNYPEEALSKKIQGSVTVNYDVDIFGDVISTKVTHGLGYGCDEEACRIVKLIKYPKKKYQGMRVIFHMNISIHFRIHTASKPAPQQEMKIVYDYVEKKK